jgi:hypothetical protein
MRDGEAVIIHDDGSWEPYDELVQFDLFDKNWTVYVIGSDDWWKLEAGLRYDIRTFNHG